MAFFVSEVARFIIKSTDILTRIPLGRIAKENDLFGTILLLSSSASDMITGQTIFVDGRWTAW